MFYKSCAVVLILLVLVAFNYVISQNCREYSQTCIDDKGCCGGCCLDGICRDTYQDCRRTYDPCMDIYCPPDQDCYVFQPQNCGGCGPVRECRSIPPPPEEILPNQTKSNKTTNNLANSKSISATMLHLAVFFIYFM